MTTLQREDKLAVNSSSSCTHKEFLIKTKVEPQIPLFIRHISPECASILTFE